MLTPKWEKLANELKHTVKVAYWDTETNGATPPLLGQIKGTPTIKAFVPSRKSARNEKVAVDYEQVDPSYIPLAEALARQGASG